MDTDRALKEEQRQRQIAESLQEVAIILNSSLDRDTVLDKILEQLRRVINYDGASILLPKENNLVVWNTFRRDAAIGFHFPLASNNPTVRVFKSQQPLVIADVQDDPDWVQLKYPIRGWMGVPLLTGPKIIGVLSIDSFEVGAYTQADTQVLQTFANQAALAIQNAQLFNETEAAKQAAEAANAELQAANTALKTANTELDAFAHTVAHDLQNPLGLIIGYSDYLMENFSETEPEQILKILQTLRRTGQKMSNITNELLLLASVRKGTIKLEALDMAEIVEQVQQRLAFMIEEYRAEIILPESWPVAQGYAPWVEEVWANYLSNGLKYGGRPPHLELGASLEETRMIRFWIRDNGSGLPPEAQAQLFSQFTRLDETRATGHGLGLSIVKRIVEKLGGKVGVESKGIPGEGSVFSFTLLGS